ncbi:MAG: sugar ABC transporter substrate-binding protein [Candidatus Binatia bacterium]
MKWGLAVFGLSVCMAVSVGCHDRQAEPVLRLWALGREGEVVQSLVPEFERAHPDIRVLVQQIPWSAAHEKLLTAYVGGSMPDVFQLGNTWIPEFVALNALDSLDERLRRSTAVPADDFFPGVFDASVVGGRTYGLPWYVDTRLLFYRTDLLAAAGFPSSPRSWNDWVAAMTKIQEQATGSAFAALLPINEWQPLVIMALQRGATLLRDGDTRGDFRSAPFREAFAFYVDLFRRGLAPLTSQVQVANLYQDFARGAFAFYVSGPWNIGEFRTRLPTGVPWATAPWPAPDGDYPGVSLAGGASLAIFRGSPRKEAAWALVEFLSEPAQQLALYRLTGDLPARKSAWTRPGPGADPSAEAFRTQLERVRPTPKIPEWERIADQITRYAESAVRAELGIDEALHALDRDVDVILEKRRWMMRREAAS